MRTPLLSTMYWPDVCSGNAGVAADAHGDKKSAASDVRISAGQHARAKGNFPRWEK
jgi:hypothetical protein